MAIFYIRDSDGGTGRCSMNDVAEVFDDCNVNLPPARPYMIIKVAGLTRTDVVRWIDAHVDNTDPENPVILMRRLYMFDTAKLTTQQRNAFLANRYIELTLQQARKCVKNKVTGVYEG